MKRTPTTAALSLASLACIALFTACAEHAAHSAHWSYSGETGPSHWGDLESEYVLAKIGSSQSPINIESFDTTEADLPRLEIDTSPVPLRIVNNGHTVQVNTDPGSTLRAGNDEWRLLQFHFHSPSEHTIDGDHAAIEMHMVHQSETGQLAVIGVMIHPGAHNASFNAIWDNLPVEPATTAAAIAAATTGVRIDPGSLLPSNLEYFAYDGSLTTPPCSEGVRWFMLKTPISMSHEQIRAFQGAYVGNNRPTQPINARLVLSSE